MMCSRLAGQRAAFRTDASLIAALHARDAYAERHFVQHFTPSLRRYLVTRGVDEDDADDLLQLTFLRAFVSLGQFRCDAVLSTWLHGIAHYVFLMHLRAERRRIRREGLLCVSSEYELLPVTSDPYLAGRLHNALQQLRPLECRALLMHAAGYTHAEISECLDVAIGTSKALLHRARAGTSLSLAADRPV